MTEHSLCAWVPGCGHPPAGPRPFAWVLSKRGLTSQLNSQIYGGHDHDHERISTRWGKTLGEAEELVAVVVVVVVVVVLVLMVEGRAKDEDEGRGILASHCTYSM